MPDQLPQTDNQAVDELVEIRKERTVLEDRLSRLEAEKGKISDTVYERVRQGYESQVEELAARSRPLEQAARQDLAKLRRLLEKEEQALAATMLDQEELEVRHRVGELDEGELRDRLGEVESVLRQHRSALEEISKVKTRFVEAFGSEEELEAPVPAVLPEPTQPVATGPAVPAQTSVSPGVDEDITAAALPPDKAEVSGDQRSGVTVLLTTVGLMPERQESQSGTTILPLATLIPEEAFSEITEFPVEPLTTIGRTPSNQIQIEDPTVSRKHAKISLSERGYVLEDLGSENGSYVNGDRVQERVLAEGDRIQVGIVRFVFSRRPPGSRTAAGHKASW